MSIQVKGRPYPFEIKRLPSAGLTVEWTCPECGDKNYKHLDNDYLKFVMVNGGWKTLYLPECDACYLDRDESYEHQAEYRVVMHLEIREKEADGQ